MRTKAVFAFLALALAAAPLSAQVFVRRDRASGIPPGQLPPRGMCRVWIDGVPPGQQPPVTDCATAERNRVVNSRVIYGDAASFPGKGKGKFKSSSNGDVTRTCSITDAVVVNGRVVNVCRDDNRVMRDANGRIIRRGDDDDDANDRFEHSGNGKAKVKAIKAQKKGKKRKDD